MRISDHHNKHAGVSGFWGRLPLLRAAIVFAVAFPAGVFAFDVKEAPPAPVPKGTLFKSVGDAIRAGISGLRSGNTEEAVEALGFAAKEGNVAAQSTLGRMYAHGDGVSKDDYKAYRYYSEIANLRADESPDSPNARAVAQAFVALGGYHLAGIPNSRVKRDPVRATEMFHYAASYFNDADAQYNLGRIFAEGLAGPKDLQQAARWYHLAAEKGHTHAQARLGQMLFNGDGVPRQAPRGLMWMQAAARKADPARDSWVHDLNTRAREVATEDERRLSESFLKKFERSAQR